MLTPSIGACLGAPACGVKAGGVAWVSASNALTNGVLGWAGARGLGFSRVVALGDEADVDAGDILDFLASDPATRAILLAIESVRAARKFMSAARAAARNKPVLVLRTGQDDPFDALYGAAFRRAGLVRVDSLDDLLDEIETLGVGRVAAGDHATVITSDPGVAALAVDAFTAAGASLAQWPVPARDALSAALPRAQAGNPLLLGDDAAPAEFGVALEALAAHRETGTAFVVHAPTHSAPVAEVARTLIAERRHAYRGLLACFFGCVDAATRDELHANGIPVHTTPHRLARGFARLVDYRLGRELLMQTPDGLPAVIPDEIEAAQSEAREALQSGIAELEGERAARLLARYSIVVKPGPAGARSHEAVEVEVRLLNHRVFGPAFEFRAEGALGLPDALHEFALPPLNPVLSRDLVMRSPRARELPAETLLAALTALSQLVCDVEQIVALRLTMRVTRDCGGRARAAPDARRASQAARDRAVSALSRRDARLARHAPHRAADPPGRRGRAQGIRRGEHRRGFAAAVFRRRAQLRSLAARAHDADRLRPRDGADRRAGRTRAARRRRSAWSARSPIRITRRLNSRSRRART